MSDDKLGAAKEVADETYRAYYEEKGVDRNDPLANPEVLFQQIAADVALARALRPLAPRRRTARVLDVGCGTGNTLLALIALGYPASNMTGVDVLPDRIAEAKKRVAGADLRQADARRLEFKDGSFDIVLESTVFLQMTDQVMAKAIAGEMIRVLAPGGSILLRDWRVGRGAEHAPLDLNRIRELFGTDTRTRIVARERGALLPPLGRFLSKHARWAYFLVQAVFPFLSAQMVTRLQRQDGAA